MVESNNLVSHNMVSKFLNHFKIVFFSLSKMTRAKQCLGQKVQKRKRPLLIPAQAMAATAAPPKWAEPEMLLSLCNHQIFLLLFVNFVYESSSCYYSQQVLNFLQCLIRFSDISNITSVILKMSLPMRKIPWKIKKSGVFSWVEKRSFELPWKWATEIINLQAALRELEWKIQGKE